MFPENFLQHFQNFRQIFPNILPIFFQKFIKYYSEILHFSYFRCIFEQCLSPLLTFYQIFFKFLRSFFKDLLKVSIKYSLKICSNFYSIYLKIFLQVFKVVLNFFLTPKLFFSKNLMSVISYVLILYCA